MLEYICKILFIVVALTLDLVTDKFIEILHHYKMLCDVRKHIISDKCFSACNLKIIMLMLQDCCDI